MGQVPRSTERISSLLLISASKRLVFFYTDLVVTVTVSRRMTFDDFCRYFVSLAVCQPMNTSSLSRERTWNEILFNGEWALPHRVGGCINNRQTFLNNPQVIRTCTSARFVSFADELRLTGSGL